MSERRQEERVSINTRIEVMDIDAEESIGFLVDISSGGFLVATEEPIEVGTLFQFCLLMPENTRCSMSIGAEAAWQQKAPDSSHFWVGFRIIDISDQDAEYIDQIINAWQEEEEEF